VFAFINKSAINHISPRINKPLAPIKARRKAYHRVDPLLISRLCVYSPAPIVCSRFLQLTARPVGVSQARSLCRVSTPAKTIIELSTGPISNYISPRAADCPERRTPTSNCIKSFCPQQVLAQLDCAENQVAEDFVGKLIWLQHHCWVRDFRKDVSATRRFAPLWCAFVDQAPGRGN
jgi:hypothetical protein